MRNQHITTTVSHATMERLQEIATREEISRSALVARIISEWLAQEKRGGGAEGQQ